MSTSVRPYVLAAVTIVIGAILVRHLSATGLIDGDSGTRITMLSIGFIVAACGNVAPKLLDLPRADREHERLVQNAKRRVGWVMTLAGCTFSLIWLLAPTAVAQSASVVVLACAVAYTIITTYRCRKFHPTI